MGNTPVTYTVTLDKAVEGGFDVAFAVDPSSTAEGSDYSVLTMSPLIFAGTAGESHDITVNIVGDEIVEANETVVLKLGMVTGTLASAVTTGDSDTTTIENDDTAVLSINNISVAEGGVFTFTVTSSNASDTAITGTINTANIAMEAVAGMDYTALVGTMFTILGDSTDLTDSITVMVNDDLIVEDDETFNVNLTSPLFGGVADATRATFVGGDAIGEGTIENNDLAVLSIDNISVAEGGVFTFTVTSSNATDTDITGTINTADIPMEALAGTDYTALVGTTFTILGDSMDLTDSITVTVNNDLIVEDNETFNVNLTSPLFGGGADATRATFVGGDAVGEGTIENNDTAVLSINNISVLESGVFTFTVTSSNATDTDITGTINTADIPLEAVAGMDYTALVGTTFTILGDSMDLTDSITVTVNDDLLVEPDEKFAVNLTNPLFGGFADATRATFTGGDASGEGTIVNNDVAGVPVVINLTNTNNTIVVSKDIAGLLHVKRSGVEVPGYTPIAIGTVNSLTINGGSAVDKVTLDASLNGAFIGTFTFNGGTGVITDNLVATAITTFGVTFNGGDGNDLASGGAGNDTLNGGNGVDVFSGNGGNDDIHGGAGADRLYGNAGNDCLDGGDEVAPSGDLLDGGDGNDTIQGGAGKDTILAGNGIDIVDGGADNDSVIGGAGNDIIKGGIGSDILNGGDGDDILLGGDGDDKIFGGIGNDSLVGGIGNDTLTGDAGADSAFGGTGTDVLSAETTSADGDGVFVFDDTLLGACALEI